MAEEQQGEAPTDEHRTEPWRPRAEEVAAPVGETPTVAFRAGERTRAEPGSLSDAQVVSRMQAVERIDRFTVVRVLGEGGMGIVSLAYDEELDRKVALKVIRQGFCDQPEHRRRFVREARALARLTHPNVVTIYEVGEVYGRPFLAMQYVEGVDLRRWMRQAPRSQREVIRVFVDVARGLAAAHAAGLVHRDVKPANILVGVDGHARIVDFGLSRAPDSVRVEEGRPDDSLTAVGAIIGTPAYMSPEQLMGRGLDASSDQYAFAVVLHEALVGTRPHAGKTVPDRRREGFEVTFPADSPVPRRIQRVLTRALAEAPARRFRTMDELIAALTADPWRRWRRIGTVAAVAAAAAGAGYGLTGAAPCADGAQQLAGAWGPAGREEVRAALQIDEAGAERLGAVLDDYADAWGQAHDEVCMAHHRGESSAGALDVRMDCLGGARRAFTALAEAVRRTAGVELDAALVAARGLPVVAGCLTLGALASGPPPPSPTIAAEVEELRGTLARAGYGPQGDDAGLRAIVARADALEYRPLAAEALATIGRRETERAEYEAAAVDLEAALWLTTMVDDPEATAEVLAALIYVLGDRLSRVDLVDRWRPHAEALAGRLGPGALGSARLLGARGQVDMQFGRVEPAIAELKQAVAIAEALYGPDHVRVAEFVGPLASALATAGEWLAAQRAFERSLAILERAYGPDHSLVVTVLGNLGNVHVKLGDPVKAAAIGEDAVVRAVRGHGDEHPLVARAHMNLASARKSLGQLAQARGDLLEARRIQRARLGPHRELRHTLKVLTPIEVELRDYPAARFHGEELIGVTLALYPADAPEVFAAFADALDVELAAEDDAAALLLAERALARPLARGLADTPDIVAYLQFQVARVLRAQGRDPARATALAAAAEPLLAAEAKLYPDELAELAAWRRPRRR